MTDRELDAAIAEKVMGWTFSPNSGWFRHDGTALWESVWSPSTDHNSAALVLKRIGELGLTVQFVGFLRARLISPFPRGVDPTFVWLMSTPRQLMEAALAVLEGR